MRVNIGITVLLIFLLGCTSVDKNSAELEVFKTVYESIPSELPVPPRESIDSIRGKSKFFEKSIDSIFLKTALSKGKISNHFKVFRGSPLEKMDSLDMSVVELIRSIDQIDTSDVFLGQEQIKYIEGNSSQKIVTILTFSRVAFNKDRSKAAVQVNTSRGKLNGASVVYLLTNVNGTWRITHTKRLYIS